MSITTSLNRFQPQALAVLRILTGYLFLLHGTAKLFALPHVAMFDGLQLFSLYGLAGVLELIGGIFFILGFLIRPTAFILSGQMAVAYFMAHAKADNILLPLLNHGEGAVLFCFIFLYFVFSGSGAWALDNRLFRR